MSPRVFVSPLAFGECVERLQRALRFPATADDGDLVGETFDGGFVAWRNHRATRRLAPLALPRTFLSSIARGSIGPHHAGLDGTRIELRFAIAPSAWLVALLPSALGVALIAAALITANAAYAWSLDAGAALLFGGWALFALGLLLRLARSDDREAVADAIARATCAREHAEACAAPPYRA